MAFNDTYRRQVALLIRTLPIITKEECFALKGGTAINLFVRDLPRLSVDIDLTYLPVRPRTDSLADIDSALKRIAEQVLKAIPDAQVTKSILQSEKIVTKLFVRANGVQIKIEVTPVLRGCVGDPQLRSVSPTVEESFGFAEARLVSHPDLYGGKIVAGLDRQHPRDLFDIRDLLAAEGIDDALRRGFIVYLLSHDRPMGEVLGSPQKDISQEFERGFQGMTDKPVALTELLATREALVKAVVRDMPKPHKRFLVSFERAAPDWSLLGVPKANELPAVRWRQQNLNKLDDAARARLVVKLEEALGL